MITLGGTDPMHTHMHMLDGEQMDPEMSMCAVAEE